MKKINKLFMFLIFIGFSFLNLINATIVSELNGNLVFTGDSRTFASQVNLIERFSFLTTENYNDFLSVSFTEINTAINGGCMSNYGACSLNNPLVDRIDSDITNYGGRYIFLLPPANDFKDSILIPFDQYKQDFITVLEQIKTDNKESTIVLINNEDLTPHIDFNSIESNDLRVQVNNLILNFSNEYNTLFVDFYTIFANNSATYTVDDIHLSILGHQKLSNELEKLIITPTNYSNNNDLEYTSIKISTQITNNTNQYRIEKRYVWGFDNPHINSFDSSINLGGLTE